MSFWERLATSKGEIGVAQSEVRPSRVLEELKARLKKMTHPQLLDLGYTTGANIDLFVRLGCKVHVDDYIATTLQQSARFLASRPDDGRDSRKPGTALRHSRRPAASRPRVQIPPLEYETGQFDVVLCWDLFDYLSPEAAVLTGREIRRLIHEGGFLFGLFGPRQDSGVRAPQRFRLTDKGIQAENVDGPRLRPAYLANRDVQKLFADFEMSQTVLLKTGVREMLLRKKAATTRQRTAI